MLNKHEEILQQAADSGIEVVTCDLPDPLRSAYVRMGDTPVIALSRELDTSAATGEGARGLGHHFTGGGNVLGVTAREAERQLRRSGKWAYERLVPLDALGEAYCRWDANPYAIAEALSVTPQFLDDAIRCYSDVHGVSTQTGCYRFRFIPYFSVTRL